MLQTLPPLIESILLHSDLKANLLQITFLDHHLLTPNYWSIKIFSSNRWFKTIILESNIKPIKKPRLSTFVPFSTSI